GYAEIRRGLAEFVVPRFSDVFSARLFLRENRGWSASPAPPAHHQLSWYADVDLAVDTTDYERPASLIGVFDTDINEDPRTFEFDISSLVSKSLGSSLGFRVQMAPTSPTAEGTGFTPDWFRIEVTTTTVEANDFLMAQIRSMGLASHVEASLLRPLRQIAELLSDGDPGNDAQACERRQDFLDAVVAGAESGELEASDLLERGSSLMTCEQGSAQIRVFRDFPSFEAAAGKLVEIDF